MKRKLPVIEKSMLPEVLPDPRRSRLGPTAPRARALAQMERLMAVSTAIVAVADVGCHKEAAKLDAGPPDSGTPGPPNMGYAVVDPMPRPAYCPDIAQLIKPKVQVVKDNVWSITFPAATGRSDFKYVKDAIPTLINGALVGAKHEKDGSLVVLVKPSIPIGLTTPPGSLSVMITMKAVCDKGPVSIVGNAYFADADKEPIVTVSEY